MELVGLWAVSILIPLAPPTIVSYEAACISLGPKTLDASTITATIGSCVSGAQMI